MMGSSRLHPCLCALPARWSVQASMQSRCDRPCCTFQCRLISSLFLLHQHSLCAKSMALSNTWGTEGRPIERAPAQPDTPTLPPNAGTIPAACRPPPSAFHLLARLLDWDPNTRITADKALEHPFFAEEPLPSMDAFRLPVGGQGLRLCLCECVCVCTCLCVCVRVCGCD